MAKYAIDFKVAARKELDDLSNGVIGRLIPKIEAPSSNPRPPGYRKLRGYKDLWRIRVGDYRVLYIVNDERKTVSITRIAHRRDVYE